MGSQPFPYVGSITDPGSLAADIASLYALVRKAAKEAWETEHHFHVRERWLGLAGASEGFAPFVALPHATNDGEFGEWTEVLDAADTPIIAGSTHYDPHQILLADVPKTKELVIIQFAWGAVAATAYGDGDYTERMFLPEKPADGKASPIDVQFPRLPTDTLLWCRVAQDNANNSDDAGGLQFFLGLHEYTDPDT